MWRSPLSRRRLLSSSLGEHNFSDVEADYLACICSSPGLQRYLILQRRSIPYGLIGSLSWDELDSS